MFGKFRGVGLGAQSDPLIKRPCPHSSPGTFLGQLHLVLWHQLPLNAPGSQMEPQTHAPNHLPALFPWTTRGYLKLTRWRTGDILLLSPTCSHSRVFCLSRRYCSRFPSPVRSLEASPSVSPSLHTLKWSWSRLFLNTSHLTLPGF